MIEIKETENINIGPEDQPGGAEPHTELLTTEGLPALVERCPLDDKNNRIIPDDIFDTFYRDLPPKCVNASGTWRTTPSGGKIKILGANPEEDRAIQMAGGKALQATIKQRRTMAEDLKLLLAQKARKETVEALGLEPGATNQEVVLAAMFGQAADGNVKAGQFIRDTIGEQPTTKQEITADIITDHDRDLIQKLEQKLSEK